MTILPTLATAHEEVERRSGTGEDGAGLLLLDRDAVFDELLASAVRSALAETGHAVLRKIEVTTRDGLVQLVGCVPTYFLKQVAQAACVATPGVTAIRNGLDVSSR